MRRRHSLLLLFSLVPLLLGASWKKLLDEGRYEEAFKRMPDRVPLEQREAAEDAWLRSATSVFRTDTADFAPTDAPAFINYLHKRAGIGYAHWLINTRRSFAGHPPRTFDTSATDGPDAVFLQAWKERLLRLRRADWRPGSLAEALEVPYLCAVFGNTVMSGRHYPFKEELVADCASSEVKAATVDRLRQGLASPERRPYAKALYLAALRRLEDPTFRREDQIAALQAAEAAYPLRYRLEVDRGDCAAAVEEEFRNEFGGFTAADGFPVRVRFSQCQAALGARSEKREVHSSRTRRVWKQVDEIVGYTVGQGNCHSFEQNYYGQGDTYTSFTNTYCSPVNVPIYASRWVEAEEVIPLSRTVYETSYSGEFRGQAALEVGARTATVTMPSQDGIYDARPSRTFEVGAQTPAEEEAALRDTGWRMVGLNLGFQARRALEKAHWLRVIDALEAEGTSEALEEAAAIRELARLLDPDGTPERIRLVLEPTFRNFVRDRPQGIPREPELATFKIPDF